MQASTCHVAIAAAVKCSHSQCINWLLVDMSRWFSEEYAQGVAYTRLGELQYSYWCVREGPTMEACFVTSGGDEPEGEALTAGRDAHWPTQGSLRSGQLQ